VPPARTDEFFYTGVVRAMSVMRVGSTQKFADNWDNIFGGSKGGKKKATASAAKSTTKKKAGKKTAKKAKKK
jgi:hypothetical protein